MKSISHPVKKILVVGPAWIGDMVMAEALFRHLSEAGAIVDVLAPAWSHPLIARMSSVHQAILLPTQHGQLGLSIRYQMAKSLRKAGYDQAIVLPNSFKSALIPFWAKIPIRTGWRREGRGLILNDARSLDKTHYPLMVERFLALGLPKQSPLPLVYAHPRLQVSDDSVNRAIKKYDLSLNGRYVVVLCPAAEFGIAKRWPAKHYATLAQNLLADGALVWLMGSAKDKVITDEINALTGYRCQDFAGLTDIGEAIDVMSLAHHVITNDSGLMHIAAALDKPLVAIYGSSDPSFTPPLSTQVKIVRENLPCSPCFQRTCPLLHMNCLSQLSPEKVLAALKSLTAPQYIEAVNV
jgi:heptosyltransferase II